MAATDLQRIEITSQITGSLGDFVEFKNGRSSPDRSDSGAFAVYGSNGEIGKADVTNAPAGTLVVGRVGSYCGSVHYSPQKCWVTDNAIVGSSRSQKDSRFWFYKLASLDLNKYRAGSGQPLLNQQILNSIQVSVPASEENRFQIAKALAAFDDKIDLNRRINQTLEAMAQAIFKSWFVDFEPVKAKIAALAEGRDPLRAAMSAISGKPEEELDALPTEGFEQLAATAALFPDEMVESELGEIPKGWICPGIETLANVKQGKYLGKDEMQDTASEAFPIPVWGGNGVLGYSQKFAYSSPVVLMTCRGSNCGLIKHTESEAWVSNNSFACAPKIGSTLFLLTYFQAELFDDCVSGSAQPQITYTSLKTKRLRFPVEPNVCSQFSKLMDSTFSAILSHKRQMSELSILRDTLLPKLLSGELCVSEMPKEYAK